MNKHTLAEPENKRENLKNLDAHRSCELHKSSRSKASPSRQRTCHSEATITKRDGTRRVMGAVWRLLEVGSANGLWQRSTQEGRATSLDMGGPGAGSGQHWQPHHPPSHPPQHDTGIGWFRTLHWWAAATMGWDTTETAPNHMHLANEGGGVTQTSEGTCPHLQARVGEEQTSWSGLQDATNVG